MTRSFLLLLAGAVAGTGLTLAYRHLADGSAPESTAAISADDAQIPASEARIAGRLSAFEAERLDAYEQAASLSSPAELEAMITALASEPPARGRDIRLTALLARLGELEPRRAARIGEALAIETRLLAVVYEAWARVDPAAALAAIAAVAPPPRQQTLALAILTGLGNNPGNVARVAAALPPAARFGFEFEAVLARAKSDPAAALAAALASSGRTQQLLIPALAAHLAADDPFAALAQSSLIDNEQQRQSYQRAVYAGWAEAAPESLLEYLDESRPAEILGDYDMLHAVAGVIPEQMLELAYSLPASVGYDVRYAALAGLARRDAAAALAALQALGGDSRFAPLASVIARDYGEQNPAAAVAWAWSLPPTTVAAGVRESVIQGVAAVDYDYAVELFLADLEQNPRRLSLGGAGFLNFVTGPGADPGRLLQRLLEAGPDSSLAPFVNQAASLWGQIDPEAAMAWVMSNIDVIDPAALSSMAQDLARRNPESATLALARLTPAQRENWIVGIATSLAQSDPDAALGFLETYRGQPGYAAGLGAAIGEIAEANPARAAGLIADTGAEIPNRAAILVAGSWSILDLDAATRWLDELSNESMRNSAIAGIVMAQSDRDPGAGRRWLLARPEGALRDSGLNVLLTMSVTRGLLDTSLLDAYSSDIARQNGVGRAALALARRDPVEARRLLETYVTDPDLRLELEELLDWPSGPAIDPFVLLSGQPIR